VRNTPLRIIPTLHTHIVVPKKLECPPSRMPNTVIVITTTYSIAAKDYATIGTTTHWICLGSNLGGDMLRYSIYQHADHSLPTEAVYFR